MVTVTASESFTQSSVEKKIDLGEPPRIGSKQRKEFDARQILANWAGVDRYRNGISDLLRGIGQIYFRFKIS